MKVFDSAVPIAEMETPEWNERRKELQDALMKAANELTTFSRASRMELRVNGIRIIVQVETFDRTKMT